MRVRQAKVGTAREGILHYRRADARILLPGNQSLRCLANQVRRLRRESVERLLPSTRGAHKPTSEESRSDELQQAAIRPPNGPESADGSHLVSVEHPRNGERPKQVKVAWGHNRRCVDDGAHSRSSSAVLWSFFRRSAMSRSTWA